MTTNNCALERLVGSERYERLRADPGFAAAVDSTGMNTYSLVFAGAIDIISGRNLIGVATNRANGLWVNTLTARTWNKYRDWAYKVTNTTEDSSSLRKTAIDFIVFNTFQTPLYLGINMSGAVVEGLVGGKLDLLQSLDSAITGAKTLEVLSVLISPTLGYWQDVTRKFCGLKTSQELAKEALETKTRIKVQEPIVSESQMVDESEINKTRIKNDYIKGKK